MRSYMFLVAIVSLVGMAAGVSSAQAPPLATDLSQRQLGAATAGSDWLLYGGNYKAWRYSSLTQIDKSNVGTLKTAWSVDTGMHDAFEASPIVVDGVMYVSTPWNHVLALDAATGKQYWRYGYKLESHPALCCGAVNRGVAVGSGKVIMATLDAHLVGLDAQSGREIWNTKLAEATEGYSATTAPQVIGDKVIVGISGGDFGVRGFIDAYDINTGKQIWRFYTIPGPGEPGHETWAGDSWKTGGGPSWMAPTYDTATNTLYAGIGNPGPDLYDYNRKGDNLYTECVVALDANTGKLKWYYQTIPHDVWDLDMVIEPVLDDITVDGRPVKAVMWAGKNGYFYVLDRTNGKFIYAIPFAHKINWGTVHADGSVTLNADKFPVKDKWTVVYPGASGGKEWCPVAYDPARKRMFVPAIEVPHQHKVILQEYTPGLLYWGGASAPVKDSGYGHVTAIDVEQKKIAWDVRTKYPVVCGMMCTASGLVVTGTPDRKMLILDADNGKQLQEFKAISGWHSAPMSFQAGGKQYIGFANGWGGWVTGFDTDATPGLDKLPIGNTIYAFALP